ncbi:hypothetical protein HPULCUR_009277 [Helicostylum pulchrum]|uniref:Uncharacterized protein n=1 Tax=Helicostylum pulchrum TaxID=562976 RepID=A0ABP9Y9Z4_9FUNG
MGIPILGIQICGMKADFVETILGKKSRTSLTFFCPEKHGIIRFGENFSAGPPTMPKDLYQSLVSNNVFKSGVMNSSRSSDLILSINKLEDGADKLQIHDNENKLAVKFTKQMTEIILPSISYSESVYNDSLILRCIKEIMGLLKNSSSSPYFIPGEEELKAMTTQLSKMEVLLVETAGLFSSFDNSKSMFAFLAM